MRSRGTQVAMRRQRVATGIADGAPCGTEEDFPMPIAGLVGGVDHSIRPRALRRSAGSDFLQLFDGSPDARCSSAPSSPPSDAALDLVARAIGLMIKPHRRRTRSCGRAFNIDIHLGGAGDMAPRAVDAEGETPAPCPFRPRRRHSIAQVRRRAEHMARTRIAQHRQAVASGSVPAASASSSMKHSPAHSLWRRDRAATSANRRRWMKCSVTRAVRTSRTAGVEQRAAEAGNRACRHGGGGSGAGRSRRQRAFAMARPRLVCGPLQTSVV